MSQVLELGMNFLAADDMDARMAVQLRKRLGFGITANMHITGMHIEGKVCNWDLWPTGFTLSRRTFVQVGESILLISFELLILRKKCYD